MSPPSRFMGILRATLVVGLLGAIGGALGGLLIALPIIIGGMIPWAGFGMAQLMESLGVMAFVAFYGAVYGVVLGPLLGWTLMRRVPIGRAIGETAFAAALGVGAAMFIPYGALSVLGYPVIAAVAAALRLRYTHRHLPDRSGSPPDQLPPG